MVLMRILLAPILTSAFAFIEQYKLASDTLIAAGFCKEQLKNPANPLSEENRRVQIVNTAMQAAAGR